jgi:hypothetical protein
MIETKEELFLAELGINPNEIIEISYGASIKIKDLLKNYLAAISDTRCCETLKGKEIMSFEEWCKANDYEKFDCGNFYKEQEAYSSDYISFKYNEHLKSL